jgi:hypothetical protein
MTIKTFTIVAKDEMGLKYLSAFDRGNSIATWARDKALAARWTYNDIEKADNFAAIFQGWAVRARDLGAKE